MFRSIWTTGLGLTVAMCVSFAHAAETPIVGASDQWSLLRTGMVVFVTDKPVCNTISDALAAANGNAAHCLSPKYGTPASVTQIMRAEKHPHQKYTPELDAPFAKIRSVNGSWYGFASVLGLQPNVPIGAVLLMTPKSDAAFLLASCPKYTCDGLRFHENVKVRVVEYYPEHDQGRTLYVSILEGRYRGKRGWMDLADTDVAGRAHVGYYQIDFSKWLR